MQGTKADSFGGSPIGDDQKTEALTSEKTEREERRSSCCFYRPSLELALVHDDAVSCSSSGGALESPPGKHPAKYPTTAVASSPHWIVDEAIAATTRVVARVSLTGKIETPISN